MNEVANSIDEKPLVTFLLISYNQEKYIREAVNAAFDQTYEPLEIILSDDCSTDRTFEIITEMVATYNGLHQVVFRQTYRNIGTYAHLMDAVKGAQGGFIVLSAGDDISKSGRVTQLTAAWISSGAWGLHSRYDRIDNNGLLLERSVLNEFLLKPNYSLRRYFLDNKDVHIVHGVTSAYDYKIFEYLMSFPKDFILSEDGVLSFAINLLKKKVCLLDESLVEYREHPDSLTNSNNTQSSFSVADSVVSIQKAEVYAKSLENRTKLFLTLVDSVDDTLSQRINRKFIVQDNKLYNLRKRWAKSRFIDRIHFLLLVRQVGDFYWILPRLFGPMFFIRLKMVLYYLRLRKS